MQTLQITGFHAVTQNLFWALAHSIYVHSTYLVVHAVHKIYAWQLKVLSWIVIFWVKSRFVRQSHSQQIHSQQVRHLYGLLVFQWHQEILNLSLLFWQCFFQDHLKVNPPKKMLCFIWQNNWKFVNVYFALYFNIWYIRGLQFFFIRRTRYFWFGN